jgi:predicted nucleotidyltransferase component of viral defense system
MILLPKYEKRIIGKQAEKIGFMRDTLEKAYRLVEMLEYINQDYFLDSCLALKGGTAINMLIFNLPRLSIDIDLDFIKGTNKEEMLKERKEISDNLLSYMDMQNYSLSSKTKKFYSLDSWIFEYTNCGGNKDIIKVEINYSLRSHIYPEKEYKIITDFFDSSYKVKALAPIELFGTKILALINRGATRDLYDVSNMIPAIRFFIFFNR